MTIDKKGTVSLEVRLPAPHAKQELFIHSKKKRRIIKAGRRGGKTVGVGIYAVEQFCEGHRVLYGVPVSDQLERFWQGVVTALSQGIEDGLLVKNETEHVIEWNPSIIRKLKPELQKRYLNNRIRAKTCWNADTLRGDYADCLILDEFQLMDESAWELVGSAMLIDNAGDAVFCYTPPSLHSRSVSKAKDKLHARKLYAKAEHDPDWLALHFTSYDNPYLSQEGLAQITKDMTALGRRQEILAEEMDEVPGALWSRHLIETGWPAGTTKKQMGEDFTRKGRIMRAEMPDLVRIVVGVDPTGSTTNEAGIIAAGLGKDGHCYVIDDESILGSPEKWAGASVRLFHARKADRMVAEKNYGGDMVESTIRAMDKNVPVFMVTSTRGKLVRAEPICAAYEQGEVHHVGEFPELEDEMVTYVPGDKSPNRMDALVFALTELRENLSIIHLSEIHQPQKYRPVMMGIMKEVI
jgi:hypothetical protein